MKILVLNAGSSSHKICLYQINPSFPDSNEPLWQGSIDWTRYQGWAEIKVKTHLGASLSEKLPSDSRSDVISRIIDTIWQGETQVIQQLSEINAVGHRVVHGGAKYREPTLITPEVKAEIQRLFVLAPSHNPVNLAGIEIIEKILPNLPQVAVFDTAFHASLPMEAAIYPIPYDLFEQGIRRYGFHGISHQYCAEKAAKILGTRLESLRLITCHLGNGCSLTAIKNGKSINTTMGFTPLEGLMMGTRSGSIDPSILIHLIRQGASVDELDAMLNKESGIKGISGISGDMRQIHEAIASGNPRAQLALDKFVYVLSQHIGAMLPLLGGLDALVFTGGIGENDVQVRERASKSLEFIGLKLDLDKNALSTVNCDIAARESTVRVLVVHTEEDWAIASQVVTLLGS